MSKPKSLTVAQLLVVTTAAQRPDRVVLPLPPTLRVRGSAQRTLLATLLKIELVEEFPIDDATLSWRADDSGQHFGLRLTAAGLAAAGGSSDSVANPVASNDAEQVERGSRHSSGEGAAGAAPATTAPRAPAGKLGDVLRAISKDVGATLPEITTMTGWLPHTARAAVTGLRQRGFAIQLSEQQGRKAYRIGASG
ncbi:DUF3489 domain-containing protein [Roseococcus sp.]|uniref:DUF3489 domain-containing protein n=1 Tax=Roseococcus sp. TaxID=2109646 RepID=UPI003BA88161